MEQLYSRVVSARAYCGRATFIGFLALALLVVAFHQEAAAQRRKNRRLPEVRSLVIKANLRGKRFRRVTRIRSGRGEYLSISPGTPLSFIPLVTMRRTKSVRLSLFNSSGVLISTASLPSIARSRTRLSKNNFSLAAGEYRVVATPFSKRRFRGLAGDSVSFEFSIGGARKDKDQEEDHDEKDADAPSAEEPVLTPEIPAPQAGWQVEGRVFLEDGVPFFPFGMYYVSYRDQEKSKRRRDVMTMAGVGLNLLYTPLDLQDKDLLDLCGELGMEVILEFNDDPESLMRTFRDHPALAGIGIWDDVDYHEDDGPVKHTPAEVAERSREIKRLATKQFTYTSGGWPDRIPSYLGAADVVASQAYIIPAERLIALSNGYYRKLADAAQRTNKAWIANLQTFKWNGTSRLPSRSELRNMTYQALLLGTSGIVYYTFFDEVNDLSDDSPILTELALLSEEIKALESFLHFGAREELSSGDPYLLVGRWVLGGEAYFVAINMHHRDSKSFSVATGLQTGSLTEGFSDKPSPLSMNNGILSGTLPPEAVFVAKAEL